MRKAVASPATLSNRFGPGPLSESAALPILKIISSFDFRVALLGLRRLLIVEEEVAHKPEERGEGGRQSQEWPTRPCEEAPEDRAV